jgi:hypothetical protein
MKLEWRAAARWRGHLGRGGGLEALLLLKVADGSLDSVLGEHRAVDLDGGQREVRRNVGVLWGGGAAMEKGVMLVRCGCSD